MQAAILRGAVVLVGALAIALGMPMSASAQDADAPPAATAAGDASAPTPELDAGRRAASRYFIEFRSRSAISYGHTYVVHGRVGAKMTAKNVAGLHPVTDSSIVYMIGHVLPVPSETGASDGDLESQYTTARYRITLSEASYRKLAAYIKQLQADSPVWNAATYNCNAFVATIAHFMGLETPHTWLYPREFVNTLRSINGGRRHAEWSGLPSPRPAAPRPQRQPRSGDQLVLVR